MHKRKLGRGVVLGILVAGVMLAGDSTAALLLGPTPYLQESDSPFSSTDFTYFHLEDWEDGALNTPGVTAIGQDLRLSSWWGANVIDSVDADDGTIDGYCSSGEALWGYGPVGITFAFSSSILGQLPTHAGIVWTDGSGLITFQAWDANGDLIGTLYGDHADGTFLGRTAEDRFYGATSASGISRIAIRNDNGSEGTGIEVDHLQYGRQKTKVPDGLSTFMALIASMGGIASLRRFRR